MKNFLIILFAVICFHEVQSQQTRPFEIGEVRQLFSQEMNETRTLNIYLPQGYAADDSTKYSVVYLLDGSADEDFMHVAGLVQFCNYPWVNMLPPAIVVGIANVDRRRDFTFPTSIEQDKTDFPTTGGSEKFMAFIEKELQPFVESNYKVSTEKILIGQSFGALLATEVLLKKPALFGTYIIISPSLWWDNESLLNLPLQISPSQNISVFIGVGNEGRIMETDAKKLYKKIKSSGNAEVHFKKFRDEDHASILHIALYDAFKILFKNH